MDKEKKRPLAVIFIGIQASGKSSFYREYMEGTFVHINLDTLHTRNKENLLLEECLAKGESFVVDNTNPTRKERERYIQLARTHGYEIAGYFFQSIVADCIARNQQRTGKARVPDRAVAGTSNRLQLPSVEEGFDRLFFVKMAEGKFEVQPWKG
ncbi:ATP-binding protein [Candidatus Ventrimonas sp. KK005]